MKNDLLFTCDFQISLTINCKSTWPGLTIISRCTHNSTKRVIGHMQLLNRLVTYKPDVGMAKSVCYRFLLRSNLLSLVLCTMTSALTTIPAVWEIKSRDAFSQTSYRLTNTSYIFTISRRE